MPRGRTERMTTRRRSGGSSRTSSTELVILGLLRRRPAHGYELLRAVRVRHMSEYIRVAPSGLYKALARLEDQGCVTARAEREGSWPQRQTYSITRRGEARLQKLLLAHLRGNFDHSDALSAALTFGELAPRLELERELRRRREMIVGSQQEAVRLLADILAPAEETFFERLRVTRWAEHLAAELRWLDGAIASVAAGMAGTETATGGPQPANRRRLTRAATINGRRPRRSDSAGPRTEPDEGGGADTDSD